MSTLDVYYRSIGVLHFKRDELYSVADLAGALGGIIGLCFGFSFLSVAEFVYFFSLRWMNDANSARMKRKGSRRMNK